MKVPAFLPELSLVYVCSRLPENSRISQRQQLLHDHLFWHKFAFLLHLDPPYLNDDAEYGFEEL